ncbi:MAG: bifunctional heptose 7-phosphate kinase/heptose 1-phosphate adenyltransferase [Terriglobia bacterium]
MQISARDRKTLLAIISRFGRRRIAVLGDFVADEFIYGEIARVSREAPVLILKQREKRILPGGGANAANNLVEFGAQTELAGAVGEDEAGEALLSYFQDKGVSTKLLQRFPDFITPAKCRVLGGIGHGLPQQIVRVDREPRRPLGALARRTVARSLLPSLDSCSAVLISDYGYGATGADEARFLRRRAGRIPVTVDSRYDIASYSRLTAATPNELELEAAFGQRTEENIEMLHRLAGRMLRRTALEALVVTRGREGMVLYEPGKKPRVLRIFGSDQVADVTGAGDTVIAAFTLALAAGASFPHAAMLANCAGGLVVMKRGTATVTGRELAEAIRNA